MSRFIALAFAASALGACAPNSEPLAANVPANRAHVARMVEQETERQLGRQWVPTALRIAKVESGFRCNAVGPRTRHGRAQGVMQVLPKSARGLGHSGSLLDCRSGIRAGVAHMRMCKQAGATTPALMARCHVAGPGGLRSRSRYANQYVRLVTR